MFKRLKVHSQIKERSLHHFPALSALGVTNYMTDRSWGDMSMRFDDSLDPVEKVKAAENFDKYLEILPSSKLTRIRAANRYSTHIVDGINYENQRMGIHMIVGDGVLTSTPGHFIAIAPADCAIVAVVGFDEISARNFLIVLHIGFAGADLRIISRAMNKATAVYQFNSANLKAFIFPSISAENYKKPLSILEVPYFSGLTNKKWEKYVKFHEDFLTIDVRGKIVDQLIAAGLEPQNIEMEEACTYDLHKEGVLYSHSAQKEEVENKKERFAVILGINEIQG